MWMIPDKNKRTVDSLSQQSQNNLKLALNLDLLDYAQYNDNPSEIHAIYMGFEDDGMFFSHPSSNFSNDYKFQYSDDLNCQKNDPQEINATCLDWYYKTKYYTFQIISTFDSLDKYHKRLNFFPTALWDPQIKMMRVNLCESLLNDTNKLIGIVCVELWTARKLFSKFEFLII